MPTLFARLSKRPTSSSPAAQPKGQNLRTTLPQSRLEPMDTTSNPPVDRRIHPDLNSLVAEDTRPIRDSIDTLNVPSGFAPLHPSPRRRMANVGAYVSDRSDSAGVAAVLKGTPSGPCVTSFGLADVRRPHDDGTQMPTKKPNISSPTSLTNQLSSTTSLSGEQSTSGEEWPTFGRTRSGPGEFGEFVDTHTKSNNSATPDSDYEKGKSRTQYDASTSTLDSRSRSSSIYGHYNTASSPHTFGIPTPPSSGFTFGSRRQLHSSDTPPPLPPLNHPAFLVDSTTRPVDVTRTKYAFSASLAGKGKVTRQPKRPRHASSLPSLSGRVKVSGQPFSPKRSRKRARTQSRTTAIEIFPDHRTLNQTSTPRNHYRHSTISRSQSRGSNSGRRVSADFSAAQASSVSHGSGIAESWEAQVSRAMVQISLGEKQEWPESKMIAEGAESGQARGHNVGLLFVCHDPPFVFTHHLYLPYTIPYPSLFFILRHLDSRLDLLLWDRHFYYKVSLFSAHLIEGHPNRFWESRRAHA
jgi:hypothetical protein